MIIRNKNRSLSKQLILLSSIIAILATQSAFAFGHAKRFHPFRISNHPFIGKPLFPHRIPNPEKSEFNHGLTKSLKTMDNLYKMDKAIVDYSPGPFARMKQKRAQQQATDNATSAGTPSDK